MSSPDVHIVAPTAPHSHTIILLHGRGSNAREFASEFFESQDREGRFLTDIFPSFKWVFPCAGIRPAATEQEDMHQWFDMASVRDPHHRPEIQLQGLRESVPSIWDVASKEAEEVGGYEKVFLGGISQGCAVAVVALLAEGKRFAGFVGISSWLPFPRAASNADFGRWVQQELCLTLTGDPRDSQFGAAVQVPMLLEHAEDDEVVPVGNGRELRDELSRLGIKVEWQEYADGGHWVNEPKGIDDMVGFIQKHSS
ncbi:alpha/beta-hydrolase [Aaosphaeria arxii CBS 175.79]|uniref:Alpha/beta-hydrolase n=1 Tax=Aaosphaeria arxii CBS 175.79 TaxID=1450172 RepID=A0A6A5Y1S5_9PLEO|nr:alpha/beta-hydrolase [Aaosphaeria arxii CBS 175.79]KAF2018780.1 alpha/beta-hydrolase [Aaosphaeria arxii CBS 175.79]